MRGVSPRGPALRQALGFPIVLRASHSWGPRSQELNPHGPSNCFRVHAAPLLTAQPCFKNFIKSVYQDTVEFRMGVGPFLEWGRLAFLENVFIPPAPSSPPPGCP